MNDYQKMHYQALYGKYKREKENPVNYGLYENGKLLLHGSYGFLVYTRNEKIKNGSAAYLLKIKPII